MNSPWDVLGIPPGSPVGVVKKAYARLLRQHRPDVDPAGFRRLRDAYELVLAWAENGGPVPNVGDFEPTYEVAWPPPHDSPAAEAPSPAPPLRSPEPGADRSRPRELAGPLREALVQARSRGRPHHLDRLARLLAKMLLHRPEDLALVQLAHEELGVENAPLRLHLRAGRHYGRWVVDGVPMGRALLLAHIVARDFERLWADADELERLVATSADAVAAEAAVDAVRTLALLDPERASKLADAVFRGSSPELRLLLGEADVWIQAGQQLRERHLREARSPLVLALCDPRVGDEHPIVRRALEHAADAPRAPIVAALVADRFPAAWSRLEPVWRRKRNALGKRAAPGSEEGWGWRRVVWLVVLLSIIARVVISWVGTKPSYPSFKVERIEKMPSGWNRVVFSPDGQSRETEKK